MADIKLHPERELTDEEAQEILSLKSDDICATLLMNYFGRHADGKDPRFYTNDYFKLPTSRFGTKKEVYTTIGIYIANLHLIQPHFAHIFGYINKPFTGKVVEEISDKLANCVYTDKISTDDMADFHNRIQWLGGDRVMSLISPSITSALIKEPKEIIKRKKELFEQYKDELRDDNPNNAKVAARIEKELVKMSEEFISTQDGAENFESLSKVNISNHYKNMNVMKGAILDPYTGTYRVNQSNYNSGISKEEYSSFAGASVMGSYGRAINTEKGGYMAKESNQALNAVRAAAKGSDCGTRKTLRVFLYKKNKNDYLYRYILDKGVLTELTPDNWSQYEETWVDMRSPLYCKEKEPCYCNICLGNQPYMLNLENFGLAISRIPNKLLTISISNLVDVKPARLRGHPKSLERYNRTGNGKCECGI